jgi:hypothetical protein
MLSLESGNNSEKMRENSNDYIYLLLILSVFVTSQKQNLQKL